MLGHRIALTMLGAALMTGTTAGAAALYTAPLWVSPGAYKTCTIINVGKKPLRDVLIARITVTGAVDSETDYPVLEPGQTGGSLTNAGQDIFACRFIFKGSRRSVRAAACGENRGCLPAQ